MGDYNMPCWGGQEIYTGEEGIEDWFRALNKGYDQWEICISDKMVDYKYVGDSSIRQLLGNRNYKAESSLHLSVSLRSFRSEKLSDSVKALLDNEPQKAKGIYNVLNQSYPIV